MTYDSRRASQEQFGRQASYYAISPVHRHGDNLNVVQEYIQKGTYEYAVDIATGAGFTSFLLAEQSQNVLATDITASMLEETRRLGEQRGLANVGQGFFVAEALGFSDNSLDIVSCRTAPHHFENVDLFLDEISRVLKTGGVFVMSDTVTPEEDDIAAWMNDIELRRDSSHIRDWAPSEWLQAIENRGLKVTDSAITRAELEFNNWVERSGTADDEVGRLRQDFLGASDAVNKAFMIDPHDGGGLINFSWPALVVRAVKA